MGGISNRSVLSEGSVRVGGRHVSPVKGKKRFLLHKRSGDSGGGSILQGRGGGRKTLFFSRRGDKGENRGFPRALCLLQKREQKRKLIASPR